MKKIRTFKPLFTGIITTANKYQRDSDIITFSNNQLNEVQEILAIGDSVRNVKIGDKVLINPNRYTTPIHKSDETINGTTKDKISVKIDIPTLEVGGRTVLLIEERDIIGIVTE